MTLGGGSHRGCGLAGSKDENPSRRRAGQVPAQHLIGVGRAHGSVENGAKQGTFVGH